MRLHRLHVNGRQNGDQMFVLVLKTELCKCHHNHTLTVKMYMYGRVATTMQQVYPPTHTHIHTQCVCYIQNKQRAARLE